MQKRIAFRSKSVYMLMAGAFLFLGLQGCTKDYVRCEVIDTLPIVHHSEVAELATELDPFPDRRGLPPGACYTTPVTSPYSAAGYVRVTGGQINGTAPAGASCISTTSKCSAPGSLGCGQSQPVKRCRHAWIEQTPGSLINPCGCVCAP